MQQATVEHCWMPRATGSQDLVETKQSQVLTLVRLRDRGSDMADGGTSGMAVTPPLETTGQKKPIHSWNTPLRPLSEGVLWRGVVPQSWDLDVHPWDEVVASPDDPLRGSHTSLDG